ncbi:hypothetical protein [Ereboglobus sp. PH5-5]|uniref:hypothetical protein n=1 Tax=Ereboglobus sp. PH5-5 TaxID=2940529 RepID=UPI0024076BA4|nr:hypothetical protein [Ereboglobus sp. PH5-5]
MALFAFALFPLKDVFYNSETNALHIKGLTKEIVVDICDIVSVKNHRLSPEMITITLNKSTPFGTNIRFIPPHRIGIFSQHPTVDFLQKLALFSKRQNT